MVQYCQLWVKVKKGKGNGGLNSNSPAQALRTHGTIFPAFGGIGKSGVGANTQHGRAVQKGTLKQRTRPTSITLSFSSRPRTTHTDTGDGRGVRSMRQ